MKKFLNYHDSVTGLPVAGQGGRRTPRRGGGQGSRPGILPGPDAAMPGAGTVPGIAVR